MWLNYDEKYAVSDEGQVMNKKTGLVLKPLIRTNKYGYVTLSDRKKKDIHRLVAECFLPKIDLPGLEVDHINRDKTDNRANNLRWCSRSQNSQNTKTVINAKYISKSKTGYAVRFKKNNKYIYWKWFKTIEEAIIARDAFKLTDEYLL
jgi:hypothetical protein